MEKFKAFLKRKNITVSAKKYGIDTLGAMAQGLFATLLIGTIILFAADILREKGHDLRSDISAKPLPIRWAVWFFLIFFAIAFGKYSAGGFIYAQF